MRLGEHSISSAVDCAPNGKCLDPVQDIAVESRIKHAGYDSRRKINDIGLLKLQFAADTTKRNVRTICLPTTEDSQINQIDEAARESMLITGEIFCLRILAWNQIFFQRLGTDGERQEE